MADPTARLCHPMVRDYLALAERMPPDEVAQYLSATGHAAFDVETAACDMLGLRGLAHCIAAEDGRPLAIGGYEPLRPGVYQCWMVSALEDWPTYGHEFTRLVSALHANMLEREDCHRLQILSAPERGRAHRWYVKGLGMTLEGTLRKFFADGSDALCFAIVKES